MKKIVRILILVLLIIVILVLLMNLYIILITKSKIKSSEKLKDSDIDCIIILGAGIRGNNPSPMLEDRLLTGIELYKQNVSKKIIVSGDHGQINYDEVNVMKNYLIKNGIPSENIFMMANGKTLEITSETAKFGATVPSGKIMVDGLGVGDVGNIVLRDRQHLSQDGLIIIVLTMDSKSGEVISGPDVISRGFVYVRDSENLMDEVKAVVRETITNCEETGTTDWATIKGNLRDDLREYIFKKTKRNPMILPIIMDV